MQVEMRRQNGLQSSKRRFWLLRLFHKPYKKDVELTNRGLAAGQDLSVLEA